MKNDRKYYVTMTDKFMSGWGEAAGKVNKLVIECEKPRSSIFDREKRTKTQ